MTERNAYCPLVNAERKTVRRGKIGIQTTIKKPGDVVLSSNYERKSRV